jgi:glycosyltransferase involved in cell wall biosynthesis
VGKALRRRGKFAAAPLTEACQNLLACVAGGGMQPRFVLCDPSFVGYTGHCLEYLLSLEDSVRTQGYDPVYAGNRSLSPGIASQLSALRCFTHWCDARPCPVGVDPNSARGRELVRTEHERRITLDLNEIDSNLKLTSRDILFINTLRHWPLRGVVDWLDARSSQDAPHIVLVLHFTAYPNPDGHDSMADMYADAFKKIERSKYTSRFVLCSDAKELIDEYRTMTHLEVFLAPIPHCRGDVGTSERDRSDTINIAYIGEARYHKGFHLLPYVVRGVRRDWGRERVRFKIQSFANDPAAAFYIQTIGKLDVDDVELFPYQMDEREYRDFLSRSDIVVVPYLLDNYYRQTSGIYAEAVAAGKVTIVSKGTWMARQVEEFGGGLAFAPNDPQSFLEATQSALSDYDNLHAGARVASARWRGFHTPENMVASILDRLDR